MKNTYTYIGIVWIVIVGLGAYMLWTNYSGELFGWILWTTSLMSYVPGIQGQVLILKGNENMQEVIQTTNQLTDPQQVAVIESIEEVIVYQAETDTQPVNLLFVEWDDTFNFQALQELWLVDQWQDYVIEKLWNNQYVYTDTMGLAWYQSVPKTDRFASTAYASSFLEEFETWTYNAWFFSTPEWVDQLGGMSAVLASNLQSVYLLSTLDIETPSWSLVLQMNDGTVSSSSTTFAPTLQQYTTQSLFFLELQALQDFLGIEPNQIQSVLPFALQGTGIPLPTPDQLESLIQSTIAITIQPSLTSPLGVQVGLIIDGDEQYDTLKTLYPFVEQLVSTNLAQMGTGTTIETFEEEMTTRSVATLAGSEFGVLSLVVSDETTQLILFGETLNKTDLVEPVDTPDWTVAVFGWDSWLLNQLLGWTLPTGVQTWTLKWTIQVDSSNDQIVIWFEQKSDNVSD